jgi:hypothetical protein
MSWFPWASAPARSNMTAGELIDWLRYRAIDFGMPPQFIDAVDALDLSDKDAEIEKLGDDLTDLEKVRDDLYEELESLVNSLDENLDPDKSPPEIERTLGFARKALERHSK